MLPKQFPVKVTTVKVASIMISVGRTRSIVSLYHLAPISALCSEQQCQRIRNNTRKLITANYFRKTTLAIYSKYHPKIYDFNEFAQILRALLLVTVLIIKLVVQRTNVNVMAIFYSSFWQILQSFNI